MSAELPGAGPDERARVIDGLRVLATALEQHPEIPLPYEGIDTELTFYFLATEDPRAEMAAAARALPCAWRKEVTEDSDLNGRPLPGTFRFKGLLGGLRVELVAYRDAVCERVVTGTEDREVDEVVTPAVTRKVVKPVETVEWRCHPVMSALNDESPREVTA